MSAGFIFRLSFFQMHMNHDDSDIYSFSIPSCSDVQDALACAVFPENLQPVCVQNVQPVCSLCAACVQLPLLLSVTAANDFCSAVCNSVTGFLCIGDQRSVNGL